MLLYGCLFSCLDPVLTVACCMAYRWVGCGGRGAWGWRGAWAGVPACLPATNQRVLWCAAAATLDACWGRRSPRLAALAPVPLPSSPPHHPTSPLPPRSDPWVLPAAADARRAAAAVRTRLSSEAGGSSDHLATVKAYNQWKGAAAVSGACAAPLRVCVCAVVVAGGLWRGRVEPARACLPTLILPHPLPLPASPCSAAPTEATAPTASCLPPPWPCWTACAHSCCRVGGGGWVGGGGVAAWPRRQHRRSPATLGLGHPHPHPHPHRATLLWLPARGPLFPTTLPLARLLCVPHLPHLPHLPHPAELVSRGFVRSLEAASANAHRSDLVRAVLVRALRCRRRRCCCCRHTCRRARIGAGWQGWPGYKCGARPGSLVHPRSLCCVRTRPLPLPPCFSPPTCPLPPSLPSLRPLPLPPQACGFYPHIARVLPLPPQDKKARTAVLTRKDERVRIHPASVNAK